MGRSGKQSEQISQLSHKAVGDDGGEEIWPTPTAKIKSGGDQRWEIAKKDKLACSW